MSETNPIMMRFWDNRGVIMDRAPAIVQGDVYSAKAPSLLRVEFVDILQTEPSTRSLGRVKMAAGGELIDKNQLVVVSLDGLGGGRVAR